MMIRIITIILFVINIAVCYAQKTDDVLISEIIINFENYHNKTCTLKLRFKYLDDIFNKIVFYDKKNYDIVFDILEYKKSKSFQRKILNLHQGMEYIVEFTAKEVIRENYLTGELISFQPLILFKLPEGK